MAGLIEHMRKLDIRISGISTDIQRDFRDSAPLATKNNIKYASQIARGIVPDDSTNQTRDCCAGATVRLLVRGVSYESG
jgi:hypothetical protein